MAEISEKNMDELSSKIDKAKDKKYELTDNDFDSLKSAVNSLRRNVEMNAVYLGNYSKQLEESLGNATNTVNEWKNNLKTTSRLTKENEKNYNKLLQKVQDAQKKYEADVENSGKEIKRHKNENDKHFEKRVEIEKKINEQKLLQSRYQLELVKYEKAKVDSERILAQYKDKEVKNLATSKVLRAKQDVHDTLRDEILNQHKDKLLNNGLKTAYAQNKYAEKINNFKADWKTSTGFAKVGIASDVVNKGTSAFSNFMNKDKVSISDVGNKAAEIAGNFGGIGKAIGAVIQIIAAVLEQYDKINKAASDYVRNVGGGVAKMEDMKDYATKTAIELNKIGGLAYKFDKILEHTAELSERTGRVMDKMSDMDTKSMEDLNRWGISSDILAQYDTFGVSVENIDKRITSIYKTSSRHGLNAKAVTAQVTKNLKLAQQFTFKGGLDALTRMAEKATALKIDMGSASGFAEKVSTLEGAAKAGAQLSVLGGSYARLSNPMQLLHGGVLDEEEIFNKMLNMTKGQVKWDENKKQFDMGAFEKMNMKAAASAMGIDFGSLWTQAMNQGRLERVNSQLTGARNISIDEDTRKYIQNIAQINENGEAYVRLKQGDKYVTKTFSQLTDNDKESLKAESIRYSDEQADKIGTILKDTRTITDKLNDMLDVLKNQISRGVYTLVQRFVRRKKMAERNFGLDEDTAIRYAELSRRYKCRSKRGLKDEDFSSLTNYGFDSEKDKDILKKIKSRELSLNEFEDLLRNKMIINQQEERDKKESKKQPEGYARGGIISGKGTSTSDSIHAMVSNGEAIIPAKSVSANPLLIDNLIEGKSPLKHLEINNGSNLFKHLNVSENRTLNRTINEKQLGGSNNDLTVNIPEIKVGFTGAIDLLCDGSAIGKILADELKSNAQLKNVISEQIKMAFNNNIRIRTSIADSTNALI